MAQIHDKRRASTGIHAPPSGFLLLSLLLLLSVNVPRVVSLSSGDVASPQLSIRKVSTYSSLLPPLTTLRTPPLLSSFNHHQSPNRNSNRQNSGCDRSNDDSCISFSTDSPNNPNNNNKNNHRDQNNFVRLRRMRQRVGRSIRGPIKPYKSYFGYDSLQFRRSRVRRTIDKGSTLIEKTLETTTNRKKSYESNKLINDEDPVQNINGRAYKKAAETTIKPPHESDEQQSDKFYLLRDINGEYMLSGFNTSHKWN